MNRKLFLFLIILNVLLLIPRSVTAKNQFVQWELVSNWVELDEKGVFNSYLVVYAIEPVHQFGKMAVTSLVSKETIIEAFKNSESKTDLENYSIYLPIVEKNHAITYSSTNLSGHEVFGECNPGDGTSCACSEHDDVLIESFEGYGQVTSNIRGLNTYINAIGFKKFTEILPNGEEISLGIAKYSGELRLPVLPKADAMQVENPQAIHMMIQLWDGRNELYESNKNTLEGVIYWDLNPWTSDYGKIKIYVAPAQLIDTGITLVPDLKWHSFELVVDLKLQEYISIAIDGNLIDLRGVKLAQVYQSTWGNDVSLSITTESMAAWPQFYCTYIFTWTTEFKDIVFSLRTK